MVLKQVDFHVGKGERVVVCGPSGSGKSTLIRILMGLERYDAGEVWVHETHHPANSDMAYELMLPTGMLFQHFHLFPHLTVLENCILAPMRVRKMSKVDADELAMTYLEKVDIVDQASKYPNTLSGGQQQRAAIARCLCMEPSLLLFDEPTSALDPEMIQEVLDVMLEVAKTGISMVCVTHEMAFARNFADKIVFMDHGEICFSAGAEAFFDNPDHPRVQQFIAKILAH